MDSTQIAMAIEAITLLGGGVAAWTKLNQEVTILKSRIISLEKREDDVQKTLDLLVEGINEIKLLLARKGIQ
jgi:prefoldin subunit 5